MDEDKRAVIEYGVDILVSTVLTTVAILILGLLYGKIVITLIYLFVTIPIRSNGGGYHAKTHWGCTLLQCISFTIVCGLTIIMNQYVSLATLGIVYVLEILLVVLRAPAEHPNNPLDSDSKKKMKLKCLVWTVLIMAISMITFDYFPECAIAASLSIGIAGLSMLMSFLNKSEDKETAT